MKTFVIAASLALFTAGAALASLPPASAPGMSGHAAKVVAAKPAHSAKSLDCSKQADAKSLHGKARKDFRSKCKKG